MHTVRRWFLPLLLASLARQSAALASAPTAEHLVGHESVRRTAQRHSGAVSATAEVTGSGEVDVHHEQPSKGVITATVGSTVYGSLVVIVLRPTSFATNASVLTASRTAIANVAAAFATQASRPSAKDVGVSFAVVDEFGAAVRLDFNVTLSAASARQAFMWNTAMDGGRQLVGNISQHVPLPFQGRCELPVSVEPEQVAGDLALVEHNSISEGEVAMGKAAGIRHFFGNLSWPSAKGSSCYVYCPPPHETLVKDLLWQEAIAMAIAQSAGVSRLQVGTLMAVQKGDILQLLFWLVGRGASEDAVRRVVKSSLIYNAWQIEWRWGWTGHSEPVYGRIALRVPDAKRFAQESGAAVAGALGKAWQLPTTAVNVSLSVADGAANAVAVNFALGFARRYEAEVFQQDTWSHGGLNFVASINSQLCSACGGPVQLVEDSAALGGAASNFTADSDTVAWSGRWVVPIQSPRVQDAFAMAFAEMASVNASQVGFLELNRKSRLREADVKLWATYSSRSLRQAAVRRVQSFGPDAIVPRALYYLDMLSKLGDSARDAYGSISLVVPNVTLFANSTAVREALRSAIAEFAAVPVSQVRDLGIAIYRSWWPVRLWFKMAFGSSRDREAITHSIAVDGGARLANTINRRLPEPFRGKCSLAAPVPDVAPASLGPWLPAPAQAGGKPYGTLRLFMFSPDSSAQVSDVQLLLASAISQVSTVPQVGFMITTESAALANVDFWVASSNATIRKAAILRVNAMWTSKSLTSLEDEEDGDVNKKVIFTACGGTTSCCGSGGRFC